MIVTIDATVLGQSPYLGDLSTVMVCRHWENEEFGVDETNGIVSTLGSSSSSLLPDSDIILKLHNFEPDYVYQNLNSKFQDPVLSQHVSDEIVVAAQRRSSNAPLLMVVFVTLTQKVFIVVPSDCSICLENLEIGSEAKSFWRLPNCCHVFHVECIGQWLNLHNSCPLCRQVVYN